MKAGFSIKIGFHFFQKLKKRNIKWYTMVWVVIMARRSERITLPLWSRLLLYSLGAILLIGQVVIFYFSINFYFNENVQSSNYSGFILLGSYILGIVASIFVSRRSIPTNYKLTWCTLILLLPLPFSVLFFLNTITKAASSYSYKHHMIKFPSYLDDIELKELKEIDLTAYNIIQSAKKAESLALYKNIDITYFSDAELKTKEMLKDMENAKSYIYMEYFIINDGVLMKDIYKVLEKKGREGVEIKIIYDALGSRGRINKALFKRLRQIPNCMVEAYEPFTFTLLSNYRDHRKITIIDGNTCYTGGDNLADEYVHKLERFGYWRDTAVRLRGNIAVAYTAMFLSTWGRIRGTKVLDFPKNLEVDIKSEGFVFPIWDGPTNRKTPAFDMFLSLIASAERYVYISTPYFVINDEVISLLKRKVEQGVDVRILMPHIPDKKTAFYMGRLNYRDIYKAGGKIYEFEKGFNHAKNIIVDDKYAFAGTINMDYRSLFLHYECGAFIIRNKEIVKMREDFIKTLDESILFDYNLWHKKKWYQRIIGYIFSIFAPLF